MSNKIIAIADGKSLKRAALLYDKVVPFTLSEIYDEEDWRKCLLMPNNLKAYPPICTDIKGFVRSPYFLSHKGYFSGNKEEIFVLVSSSDKMYDDLNYQFDYIDSSFINVIKDVTEYEYSCGNINRNNLSMVYKTSYENIKNTNEDKVSWKQILDFRSDKEALIKYRRLKSWAIATKENSQYYLTDLIAQKIDDYEWSLKKHGIETVTGVVSIVINKNTIISSAIAGALGLYSGSEAIGAMIATIPIISEISLKIVEQKVKKQDLIRYGKDGEIAILHDIKKNFTKK